MLLTFQKRRRFFKRFKKGLLILTIFLFAGYSKLYAQWQIDTETGFVFSGYNDVRIPNKTGTKISLSRELKTDPELFIRAKLIYSIGERHTIAILAAPLRLHAKGEVNRIVKFEKEEFPANIQLKSTYRFDSYRLTYRYDFFHTGEVQAGLGLTAKIRDASISLAGGNKKAEKKNTGFVPLINFKVQWMFSEQFILLLDGDALAAPQGRAEDLFLGFLFRPGKKLGLKLGYRILEGGADVDEVYNFALFNYVAVGGILAF